MIDFSVTPDSTPNLPARKKPSIEPLSHMMQRFHEELGSEPGEISVRDIVAFFADRGIGALLFLFGAPMSIPLPMLPGVSLIFSLPLFVLGGLQAAGQYRPWLPGKLADKKLRRDFVHKALNVCIPILKKIEMFSRPRFAWMLSDIAYRWTGIITIIMAFSIMFPLPFSNAGPGFAIVIMAVGRIMHDGLMILVGATFGLVYCFFLYYGAFFLGSAGIDILTHMLDVFNHGQPQL